MLVAPLGGELILEEEDGAAFKNTVRLGTGQPCAFAMCILARPINANRNCPPLWVVECMGAANIGVGNVAEEIFLKRMLASLMAEATANKMLLMLRNIDADFKRRYMGLLSSMDFILGNASRSVLDRTIGGAFVQFFTSHDNGQGMEYFNITTSKKGRPSSLFNQQNSPMRAASWALYWGNAPIAVDTKSWVQRLGQAAPSRRFGLLFPESKSTLLVSGDQYSLSNAEAWLALNTTGEGTHYQKHLGHFVKLYQAYETFIARNQSQTSQTEFYWSGPKNFYSVNMEYQVTMDMFVLHNQVGFPVGFAKVVCFKKSKTSTSSHLLPFVYVSEAYIGKDKIAWKLLFESLHKAVGSCPILVQLLGKRHHSTPLMQELYHAASFQSGSSLKTQHPSLGAFFLYLSNSIDTAVCQTTNKIQFFIDEDPTDQGVAHPWLILARDMAPGLLKTAEESDYSALSHEADYERYLQRQMGVLSEADMRVSWATSTWSSPAIQNAIAANRLIQPQITEQSEEATELIAQYIARTNLFHHAGGEEETSSSALGVSAGDIENPLNLAPTADALPLDQRPTYLAWHDSASASFSPSAPHADPPEAPLAASSSSAMPQHRLSKATASSSSAVTKARRSTAHKQTLPGAASAAEPSSASSTGMPKWDMLDLDRDGIAIVDGDDDDDVGTASGSHKKQRQSIASSSGSPWDIFQQKLALSRTTEAMLQSTLFKDLQLEMT